MTKTNLNNLCSTLESLRTREERLTAVKAACKKAGVEFVALSKKPFILTIEEKGIRTELHVKANEVTTHVESPALSSARKLTAAPKAAAKPAAAPKAATKAIAAPKAVSKTAATKAVAAVKTEKKGIGARTVELLKSGLSPKATLETLQKEMGKVSSLASCYWYSSKIRCGQF